MKALILICLTFLLTSGKSDFDPVSDMYNEKHFVIADIGKNIRPETKDRLMNAIQAQYKVKPDNVLVDIIEFRKKNWLVFDLSKERLPSVAYELKTVNKQFVIDGTSARHTCTGQECSYCTFKKDLGCYCNSGSGDCDHTVSQNGIKEDIHFLKALIKI